VKAADEQDDETAPSVMTPNASAIQIGHFRRFDPAFAPSNARIRAAASASMTPAAVHRSTKRSQPSATMPLLLSVFREGV